MKKLLLILSITLLSYSSYSTIHIIKVWDQYNQFLNPDGASSPLTIQLGDTIQWLPLNFPSMMHTITSTNIPTGATTFDQIWQAPADTFFEYIPQIAGLYEYECTPHANQGMVGSFTVLPDTTSGNDTIANDSTLNIRKLYSTHNLSIYPIPSTKTIKINGLHDNYTYKIYDMNGVLILEGKYTQKINISNLTKGIYIIKIMGIKTKMLKIIKS